MKDRIFGHEVIKATELLKENMPKLERRVDTCVPDPVRLIRSLSFNNCRARANEEIDLMTFENNYQKISKATEKFIDKCIVTPRGKY